MTENKVNRFKLENPDYENGTPIWVGEGMPPSAEVMVAINEMNVPTWIKMAMYKMNDWKINTAMRSGITYPNTIIFEDMDSPGNSHTTVATHDGASKVVRFSRGTNKIEIESRTNKESDYIPPSEHDFYAKISIDAACSASDIMGQAVDEKWSLEQVSSALAALRQQTIEQLEKGYATLDFDSSKIRDLALEHRSILRLKMETKRKFKRKAE